MPTTAACALPLADTDASTANRCWRRNSSSRFASIPSANPSAHIVSQWQLTVQAPLGPRIPAPAPPRIVVPASRTPDVARPNTTGREPTHPQPRDIRSGCRCGATIVRPAAGKNVAKTSHICVRRRRISRRPSRKSIVPPFRAFLDSLLGRVCASEPVTRCQPIRSGHEDPEPLEHVRQRRRTRRVLTFMTQRMPLASRKAAATIAAVSVGKTSA